MPCILNIETATTICSVAVSDNGKLIYEKVETEGPSHAVLLGVFVNDAVNFIKEKGYKLDAVAISCGPGSYTGLRIGVSEAKGLCYGLNIPLIAIQTPLIMAHKMNQTDIVTSNMLLCPMIDARRMEVYAALYNRNLEVIRDIQADIIDENSYLEYLDNNNIIFFGNGADKCKTSIRNKNAVFVDGIYPQASDMAQLAENEFSKNNFVDIAYFEPFYLKEFVATIAKNKVL